MQTPNRVFVVKGYSRAKNSAAYHYLRDRNLLSEIKLDTLRFLVPDHMNDSEAANALWLAFRCPQVLDGWYTVETPAEESIAIRAERQRLAGEPDTRERRRALEDLDSTPDAAWRALFDEELFYGADQQQVRVKIEEYARHANLSETLAEMTIEIERLPAKLKVGTIDCTPTWSAILPALIMAVSNGTDKGRSIAQDELKRMAELADLYVASQKEPA